MTFPRPCLYALLAACLLLPGCVANQYAIKINAITNGDIQAGIGDVYYIMAVKGQRGRSRLSGTQAEPRKRPAPSGPESDQKPPPCHSGAFRGVQEPNGRPADDRFRTRLRRDAGRNQRYRGIHQHVNGKTSKTSVSTPTYGVTGYKNTQKEVAQNKIVLLLAADSLKTKKKMWETIVTYTGNSFDNRKMLDMMVMGAKDYLAQTTPRRHMA